MQYKIAVIDRGIEITHKRLKDAKITEVTISETDKGYSVLNQYHGDSSGHGTAIAGIIHKHLPETELVSVKLLGRNDVLDEDLLCEGLKWCAENQSVIIINVSLGIATSAPSEKLYNACKYAFDRGKIIVAACHNYFEKDCYPAYFPFVYSVACGIVKDKFEFKYLGHGTINLLAKGTTQRTCWNNNELKICNGTSYATAHMTGIIGSYLKSTSNFSNSGLQFFLENQSTTTIRELHHQKIEENSVIGRYSADELDKTGTALFKNGQSLLFARRILVMPADDKEINTLVEFADEANCEIVSAISYPRMLETGFRKNSTTVPVIKRIPNKEEFEKIDTLVVGYVFNNMFDANILFAQRVIEIAISLKKNFVTWDRKSYEYIKACAEKDLHYHGLIRFVGIDDRIHEKVIQFQSLPPVKTPVISIIGTSNRQGKITTQLRVKQILKNAGYKVSHLSTEPQGVLLDSDFTFPYGGPEGTENVYIDSSKWNLFLHCAIKGIQYYNEPDIIMTGTQGGVVPRALIHGQPKNTMLSSLNFLTATEPDACICAINPSDSIDLILNTVNVLNIYCKAKVLFFVMTPWSRTFKEVDKKTLAQHQILTASELETQMTEFQKHLQRPVLNIMDQNNDQQILEIIQDYFS